MIVVERYRPDMTACWNLFVPESRNGTFLLDRRYMEYHQDRFTDHSLVFRDADGSTVGLLPANECSGALHSHQGLTYGGLVIGPTSGSVAVLDMFTALCNYMRMHGLSTLHYKTIPWIYHRLPAEEDRYALFRTGARLVRRDVLSVVPRFERLPYQGRRLRGVKSAQKAGVEVLESSDYAGFWMILEDNMRMRHGVSPVHTLADMDLLHGRFPESIRLFVARCDGEVVAGTVVYESHRVAHVQYISANDAGRRHHALDRLFDHLLVDVYPNKDYFDFGISNEAQGRVLNAGLVEQKEGFGARAVVHDHYELVI
ncbi:MAG: hypothetical protein JWL98_427 [Xanthomonadaceae bacterium]|nr:hypothetical protein [Xanthomonadaceae bacterium]